MSQTESPSPLDLLGVNLVGQHIVLVGIGGIGRQVARICHALGARLTLVDRAIPETTRSAFAAQVCMEADITSEAALRALVDHAKEADALVVTSAVCPDESAQHWDDEDWHERFGGVFHVNVEAPMRLSQAYLAAHAARARCAAAHQTSAGARIVLVGSMAGRMGGLLAGPQYAASKGALHTFVRWLALRAAPLGISVNGVAPGVTLTPMIDGRTFDATRIPVGRAAEPLEIARVVAFLASPASSYMHGQVVDVNGGAWIG
jgi:3-oxoacyl-[acyl-carrier protein] reductase